VTKREAVKRNALSPGDRDEMQQGLSLSEEALLDLVAGARFELATFGL
jgi:hypothetical protein